MAGTFKVYPGISSGSVKTIPKDWDTSWYRRFISDFPTYGDTRNAIGKGGIKISGNLSTVATIDGSNLTPSSLAVGTGGLTIASTSGSGPQDAYAYHVVFNSPASTTYVLIATLPASSLSTLDNLVIVGSINASFGGNSTADFELQLGNRNAFSARLFWKSGFPQPAFSGEISILAFQTGGVGSAVNIYVVGAPGLFTWMNFNLIGMTQITNVVAPNALVQSTSGPAGTVLYDMTSSIGNGYPFNAAPWTNATLQNAWTNFGAPWNVAGYAKLADGRVQLRGLVAGGAASTTIFTLPLGFRPVADLINPVACGAPDQFGCASVLTDGTVNARLVPVNTYFSLEGISFYGY